MPTFAHVLLPTHVDIPNLSGKEISKQALLITLTLQL